MEISKDAFIKRICNKKIMKCYLANTKEEKKDLSGLNKYGRELLKKTKLIDDAGSKYVDGMDFDYGRHSFVLELDNGDKILFDGSEWNIVRIIENPELIK